MRSSKLAHSETIARCIIAAMAIMVVSLYYMWFVQSSYISFTNIPFPPGTSQVKSGDVVPLMIEQCNSSSRPISYDTSHAIRNIYSGEVIQLESARIIAEPGCAKNTSLMNKLPVTIPNGTYIIIGIAVVPGLARTWNIEWYSIPFTVYNDIQMPIL